MTKSAVREIAVQIDTLETITLSSGVSSPETPGTVPLPVCRGEHSGREKERAYISGNVVYENIDEKRVGYIQIQGPDKTVFSTCIAAIPQMKI